MSCNCPTPNQCPDTTVSCLCGIDLNIYSPEGILIETIHGNPIQGDGYVYYEVIGSTAFDSVLSPGYILNFVYNDELERWELIYTDPSEGRIEPEIVIGVLSGDNNCPVSNCWDLDCIAVGFFSLGVFNVYFYWTGDYTNGKKSYTFSGSFTPYTDFRLYWVPDSSLISGSGAPSGTPAWVFEGSNTPGVYVPISYYFSSNECPYGPYIFDFDNPVSRMEFQDFGVTGFDLKTIATDCGCCDESILIDITFDDLSYSDVLATVVKDEYGNTLGINGNQYYSFELNLTPTPATFYLYYTGTSWIMSNSTDGEGFIYAELLSTNNCPFGPYLLSRGIVTSFNIIGSECFDCCDYYTPHNRNLLKKKKAIFVDEISSIRSREIFNFKCGPEWDYLFKKHLIFDVLNCLPYGVICKEEEQCLINNLNENCNC